MSGSELCFLSARKLSELIREREISPVEVVEALLERIGELNDLLIAYVHVSREQALAAARSAEMEISAGLYRGPLHGIPVAYKDIYDVQGLPTTAGSKVMAGYVAAVDSTVAARLRQSGAICLGKLNTMEFATGSMELFGDSRNPWHTEMTVGGSSSGPGAALAGNLVPLAMGTDTGGSIRVPAAFCGIVGLKPTYGRVSRAGIVPLSWSLDHAGPMARTVADAALMLQAIAGPDSRDPSTAARAVPDFGPVLAGDLRGIRLGVPKTFFFDDTQVDVEANVRAAVGLMRQLGAAIFEIDLPNAEYGPIVSWTISYGEAFAFHRANFIARSRDYTPAFYHKVTAAGCISAEERLVAERMRQVITSELVGTLRTVDAIVAPTTGHPAYRIGTTYPHGDLGRLTRPASIAGVPALALPCGFTSAGLPTSVQLIGRAWDEGTLVRIGHAYEQAAGWCDRRPQLTGGPDPRQDSVSQAAPSGRIDGQWVLEYARLNGLSFVTEDDAPAIAALLGPAKAQLVAARERVHSSIEPPVRPAAVDL